MKMPQRFIAPREFNQAMRVLELGFSPETLDNMPAPLVDLMIIYKNVKDVALYGGVYEP